MKKMRKDWNVALSELEVTLEEALAFVKGWMERPHNKRNIFRDPRLVKAMNNMIQSWKIAEKELKLDIIAPF